YHRVITVTRIQPRENNADPLLWQDRRQLFKREPDIEHRRTWPAGDVDGEIGRGRQMGRFWVIAHGRTIEDDHIGFRARLLDYRPQSAALLCKRAWLHAICERYHIATPRHLLQVFRRQRWLVELWFYRL